MTGIRSTTGQRRPKGTGSIRRYHGGLWLAVAPKRLAMDPETIVAKDLAFYHLAEAALDTWLREHRPDAYARLVAARGRVTAASRPDGFDALIIGRSEGGDHHV